MPDLRKHFFENLSKLAENDKDIILLVDDLCYSFCEPFQKKFPKQFINAGIIEESMTGIAAGLAISGKKPYCYGTLTFIIMRNYEFLRNDICYQNANVKMIGTGAADFLGYSHNLENNENEEDILKNLPNLKRYYPTTEKQLKKDMIESYKSIKPTYIRL